MSGFHTSHIETKRLRAMSPRREYPETIAAMNACGMQWSLVTSRGLRIEIIRGVVFYYIHKEYKSIDDEVTAVICSRTCSELLKKISGTSAESLR